MKSFIYLLYVFLILFISTAKCDDVQGCGGYVKSDVEINFAQVGIKLYTAQGSLKYETECAPNDGYYFMPVYDKGKYIIKVAPPPGWSVEPREVAVNLNGETDACSTKQDINFHFKGFAVLGQVSSAGSSMSGGPAGVMVSLHKGSSLVQTTQSAHDGQFVFTPLAAGAYTVSVAHPTWKFIADSSTVSISDSNGDVAAGSLVVRGYSLSGTVTADAGQSVGGVMVVLHYKQQAEHLHKHYAKYPPGCKAGAPEGYRQSSLGPVLCHGVTNSKGAFTFSNIVPGEYSATSHYHTQLTTYVMVPHDVPVTVMHSDAVLSQNFKVAGFSVGGRVVSKAGGGGGGAGVAGATVVLVKTGQTVTTDAEGRYVLHNVKPAKYNIAVTADELEFQPTIVSVSSSAPTVADIIPSHYSLCFSVMLDKVTAQHSDTWTVSVGKSSVTTGQDGKGCLMVAPGDYTAMVQLTPQQQNRGIRFGPPEHKVTVSGPATKQLVFSQFLGEIRTTVTCLQNCPACDLTLQAADGTLRHATALPDGKSAKKAVAVWKEVVPGKYKVLIQIEDWCWSQKSVEAEVNTDNVEVELSQSGYLLTVTSSHAVTMSYAVQGAAKPTTDSVDVQKGTTKTCLATPGVYTFTPDSCHRFSSSSYKWNTAELSLMSLVATHHTVSASIKASQAGDFRLNVAHEDGTSTVLQPVKSSVNTYSFELLVKEKDEVVFSPQSPDNLFQYQPGSYSVKVDSNCLFEVVTFKAEKALFIDGKIIPAVAGVEITVQAEGQVHNFVTDKNGKYKAGPLDNSLDYTISASLKGYTLKQHDSTNDFEAMKLAEVIVDIVDEDKKTLSEVLVSMSGGKNFRQNILTGEDGNISFHSLLPGEYFLRFAMKEYNFEPPTKMVTVDQGATISIKVKGVRVAYSAIGETSSLTGVVEADVAVEARGVGEKCHQYQEEALSDEAGSFRIRGLLPQCEYDIGLKKGDGLNKHIERMLPATTRITVAERDVTGLRLVVLRHFNQMDVVGTVEAPKEHLNTISIKVYRDDVADSPIHTIKITNHPFFMLPPMIADGKTYTMHLESSLPTSQYTYRTPEVSFVADSSFKHLKLNLRPSLKPLEAEMNHNTMAGLLLAIIVIVMMVNYEKIAPVVEWAFEIIATAIANRTGQTPSMFSDAARRARSKARKMS